MDKTTFGQSPASINLVSILEEEGDKQLTRFVTKFIVDIKIQLDKFTSYTGKDANFYFRMVLLFRYDRLSTLEKKREEIPAKVYTHLRSTIIYIFNKSNRSVKDIRNRREKRMEKFKHDR